MISWLENIGPDSVMAALSSSSYLNATNAFGQEYPAKILNIFANQYSGSSDFNSTVTAMSGTTKYRRTDFDGISYPPYTSSSSFETQTTTATSGVTKSSAYATLYKETSTTFTTDQGEYWWMGKFSQLITTTTAAQTKEWTTSAGSGSTWFTTSTKNITILSADNRETTLTFETVTTNGSIVIGSNGWVANTVVQASPEEVLYVVDGGNLKVCKSSELRLLTDVATTQTRITLSYSSPYYTATPEYYLNQTFTVPEGQTGESSETQTYRSLKPLGVFTTSTFTIHDGVIPTPTSTFLLRESYTTAQGTYTVSEFYVLGGGGGSGPTPHVAMQTTITYPVYGKLPGIRNFEGTLISFDQIVQVDVSTIQSQYYAEDPLARNGTNYQMISNSDDSNQVYESGGDQNILVHKTEPRIGLSAGYYEDKNVPANPAISQGFVAYKSGVMTSPSSYAAQLSITGKTLLTSTTNSTTRNSLGQTSSVTTTTKIGENPDTSTTTTYQTATTTVSPTYARFHRSIGGAALMPTSGDSTAYTADLTAVTYTTTTVESSSSTTTSQILSASGSGVTRLLGGTLIGGAAGFEETIFGNILGKVKIDSNGSKVSSFFKHTTDYSSTTNSGSTLSASHIEFPALALTMQNGGSFFVGGYSYTDILNN